MPMYEVVVEITKTKKYYVNAKNLAEAQDIYLIDGHTSPLYETDTDKTIVDVTELVKKNGESFD
tara:strand:+ start:7650 stop:7841 length:192 start_codon:yes stop_codon:yes gene_type:complete